MNEYADQLQQKIRSTIPLSEAMQFSIIELEPRSIVVEAPLEPNINIHGTGFAGSLYAIGVLTGWALCTHIMSLRSMSGELVVGKADIKYRSPVTGKIRCRTSASEAECESFESMFKSANKGRLVLDVEIGEFTDAILHGTYVAVSNS